MRFDRWEQLEEETPRELLLTTALSQIICQVLIGIWVWRTVSMDKLDGGEEQLMGCYGKPLSVIFLIRLHSGISPTTELEWVSMVCGFL